MKHILFSILLLCSNISIAQNLRSWKIDTVDVPMEEYEIKDKQLLIVLDSLISQIREPLLDDIYVPYVKTLYIKHLTDYKEISLGLRKYYDEVDTAITPFNNPFSKYFFQYRGMQIKIDLDEKDSKINERLLNQYFDIVNSNGSYKCLVFKSTKDPDVTWSDMHFITQIISYRVYPKRMYLFRNCWEDRVLWR